MLDNVSPEEKLLRLIRGQKKEEKAAKKTEGEPAPSPAVIEVRPVAQEAIQPSLKKYLTLPTIQKAVAVLTGIASLILAASFIYSWFGLKTIRLPKVKPEDTLAASALPKQEGKPFEAYLSQIKGRTIFGGVVAQEGSTPMAGINVDLAKDINLVGIVAGENPQAIIEDRKTQKTYYVTKGQFIGELQVEEIQEGKIILNYRGQRFELYL
jgi:type II secretory pathway component PulC